MKITLKNVRLSFPSVFRRANFQGQEGKYEASFLLDKKDTKTKALIDAAIEEALVEAKIKVASDKRFIRDGDDFDYDGYAGCWSIKSSSNKRPTVVNRDKTPLTEEDDVIYAGCYVNAIIDVWVQNNAYGKRVNSNLYGIQFVKDGPRFGSGEIDVTDEFENIDGDNDIDDEIPF